MITRNVKIDYYDIKHRFVHQETFLSGSGFNNKRTTSINTKREGSYAKKMPLRSIYHCLN